MHLVLQQVFPLGRFHATPWRRNPFDDPYGEWPPSPWRLVRAIVARWHQWTREKASPNPGAIDDLIGALCASRYSFHLPTTARKGKPLRQYFPAEFGWNPKGRREARVLGYNRSLAQDNYWCLATGEEGAVWWFLESERWEEPDLLPILDACLERITYFGRAESFTRLRRTTDVAPPANCCLSERVHPEMVPVLVPRPDATRRDIERSTDDPAVSGQSVPPGSRWMYARRPSPSPTRTSPLRGSVSSACRLLQFAVGWNVAPAPERIVRLTSRFRGAAIAELLHIKTGGATSRWSRAPLAVREEIRGLAGKDAEARALLGPHRHAEFLAWLDGGVPTRLLVWREDPPFDEDEEQALLRAAERPLSWTESPGTDAWKVKLLPLDRALTPPPGFDGRPARVWESATAYVPPRHYLRKGRVRPKETVEEQVRRELGLRGIPYHAQARITPIWATWAAVHIPRKDKRRRDFPEVRRGYGLRLEFPEPVTGPIRLGHSSTFGLGLFRPIDQEPS